MIYVKELSSSCLYEASYNDETKTLCLVFTRDGRTDLIEHFPKEMFDELCAASSPGEYYNLHIRGIRFEEESDEKRLVEQSNRSTTEKKPKT